MGRGAALSGARLPETAGTIPEALAFWAELTPDAPALIVAGGPIVTYAELWERCAAVAATLGRAGFSRDDRVVVLVPDEMNVAVAILGAACAAVAVPLAATLTAPELAAALDGLDAAGAVVTSALSGTARSCLAQHGVSVCELSLDGLWGNGPGAEPARSPTSFSWPDREATAVVSQTSGTTGRPKRVPRAHGRLIEGGLRHRDRFGLDGRDRALAAAAMTVSMGRTALLHSIVAGSSLIFPASTDLSDIWTAIETERPTWMHTAAGFLELLLRWLRSHPALPVPTSLRFVRVTAAPIAAEACAELASRLGTPILPGYSTSETGIIATMLPPPAPGRPGSTGRPQQEIRIDTGGVDAPPGVSGEIWVRGPAVLSGYLNDPELDAAAMTEDGWFRTGDLGYLDEDGFLFLTGRLKELINRGGAKIAPAEIDAVLLAYPAVQAAAVFAVPDARLGEDMVAAVVAEDGGFPTPLALRTWMLERLAPHKVPRRVWLVDDLPCTVSGKVRRDELARRWGDAHA